MTDKYCSPTSTFTIIELIAVRLTNLNGAFTKFLIFIINVDIILNLINSPPNPKAKIIKHAELNILDIPPLDKRTSMFYFQYVIHILSLLLFRYFESLNEDY